MALDFFRNTYAGNPLDRAGDRRGDVEWLARQLAHRNAAGVALWNGQALVEEVAGETRLAYLPSQLIEELSGGEERRLFLGLEDETPVFAVDLEGASDPAEGALQGRGQFEELRALAVSLSPDEAGVAATAKAVFEWRRRHRYCAVCGEPSRPAEGGWKRVCESCKAEHFPRTDPVVIMLAHHGERCMLGRQGRWPQGRFSTLAGFVEPGESIEEACARELKEEAGLRTRRVAYHSSQPWPFPASLMIGLIAEVEDDEGTPDQTELAEVRWFTRAEARELLAGRLEGVSSPAPFAIAHQLLKAWADEN